VFTSIVPSLSRIPLVATRMELSKTIPGIKRMSKSPQNTGSYRTGVPGRPPRAPRKLSSIPFATNCKYTPTSVHLIAAGGARVVSILVSFHASCNRVHRTDHPTVQAYHSSLRVLIPSSTLPKLLCVTPSWSCMIIDRRCPIHTQAAHARLLPIRSIQRLIDFRYDIAISSQHCLALTSTPTKRSLHSVGSQYASPPSWRIRHVLIRRLLYYSRVV
jgi:hypothetical protein